MYELLKIKADIRNANTKITSKLAQRDLLHEQLEEADSRKKRAEEELLRYDLVQILLQATSEFARQQATQRIEEIVTSALSVVFGTDYSFTVEIAIKGNPPVADDYHESEGVLMHVRPPYYDRCDGGAADVSLALK